jgi:uncharacterized protein (DUF433 family)
MSGTSWQDRVVVDPNIHHGTPCIKGTRVPASVIVGSLADGMTPAEIVDVYPQLTELDIKAASAYATYLVRHK